MKRNYDKMFFIKLHIEDIRWKLCMIALLFLVVALEV